MKFSQIYPEFMDSEIQILKDSSDAKGTPQHRPVRGIDPERLKEQNENGMGIFFTANSMEAGKCSIEGVTKLKIWFVEIDTKDGIPKDEQFDIISKAPLTPSILVESKNGYHIYYFAKDATRENWAKINRMLKDYYCGDHKICSDMSRVMRLPGFYHMKDIDDPFMIDFIFIEGTYYTEEEMVRAFEGKRSLKAMMLTESKKKERPRSIVKALYNEEKEYDGDDIFGKARDFSQKDLLERLSGSSAVNGERYEFRRNGNGTYQIIINGQSSGNRIDIEEKIGSKAKGHKDGGPTVIERLRYYGHDNKEIYKIIKDLV